MSISTTLAQMAPGIIGLAVAIAGLVGVRIVKNQRAQTTHKG